MVLISDGNQEHDAHLQSEMSNLICLRQSQIRLFLFKMPHFLRACASGSALPSNVGTMMLMEEGISRWGGKCIIFANFIQLHSEDRERQRQRETEMQRETERREKQRKIYKKIRENEGLNCLINNNDFIRPLSY